METLSIEFEVDGVYCRTWIPIRKCLENMWVLWSGQSLIGIHSDTLTLLDAWKEP